MSKITLNNVGSLIDATTAANTINANTTVIQTAFDNTLSRDGTSPNQMGASLDMNSQQIINLPQPFTANSPLRFQDLEDFIGGGTITNIPAGGTTNQVLAKSSNADYAVQWTSEAAEVLAGTNIAVTGGSPVTVSLVATPTFAATNLTGTAASLTAGHVTTNANLTGDVTSAGNATTLATVNSTPGSYGSATAAPTFTTNGKGLITVAGSATITPAIGSVTGMAAGVSSFLVTPSSANLKTAVTDETGSGSLVFATSPALVTPNLGTPTAAVLTSATGLPLTSGVTGTLPRANGGGATSVAGEQAALSIGLISYTLAGANFNTTSDQAIPITLPTGFTRYCIKFIIASNPSVSMTTANGGIYTAAAKGGIAVVSPVSFAGLTNNTAGTAGSAAALTVTNSGTAFYNSASLFLSLTTPQGVAATADITIQIQPLP